MTAQRNIYRDGIESVAEHVERCIVLSMGGKYRVLVRPNGRILVSHHTRKQAQATEFCVGTYDAQSPRALIAADLARFVLHKLAEIAGKLQFDHKEPTA